VSIIEGCASNQRSIEPLILERALRKYMDGQRIEVTSLAAEHGVSRAAAYRWLGSNERLLAEVVAERVRENFNARHRDHANKHGYERVLAIVEDFLRYADDRQYFPQLGRKPQRLLKIVSSDAYPVRNVTVELFEGLLREEFVEAHVGSPVMPSVIAHAIVRILESFLYSDIFAEQHRDVDKAVQLVALLIPGSDAGPKPVRSRAGVPRQAGGQGHRHPATSER